MSCQSTKCKSCGAVRPACQLTNGICSTCISLAKKDKK